MKNKSFYNLLKNILNEFPKAKEEEFKEHRIAKKFRDDLVHSIKPYIDENKYEIKGHPGQGNWADTPWLEIRNKNLRNDIFYITYILNDKYTGIYLSLQVARDKQKNFREIVNKYLSLINKDKLSLDGWLLGRIEENDLKYKYEESNILAKFYPKEIPNEDILLEDFKKLKDIYEKMINSEVLDEYSKDEINYYSLPKPFLILSGISGTGKTRFVRQQASIWGDKLDNYCLIPVRPDWHEPSDILGYVSRLSGKAEYVATDLLRFIVKSWQEIAKKTDLSSSFVSGDYDVLHTIPPYWLCLDEMNLAPVEQYFADYLSLLETREWNWKGNKFQYRSDPLLSASLFSLFSVPENKENFYNSLGIDSVQDKELVTFFENNGIPLPFNLIVAGTVNMDETTHSFSRKVLDRALSFDFSEFYPNKFSQFFEPEIKFVPLYYPYYANTGMLKEQLDNISSNLDLVGKSISFLDEINSILDGSSFKLAYRALNELFLSLLSFKPQNDEELQSIWDDFLMFKLLPRLEGDREKLTSLKSENKNILELLKDILSNKIFNLIWDKNSRIDFFNQDNDGNLQKIECRSRKKLEDMILKLENLHFTTFWP